MADIAILEMIMLYRSSVLLILIPSVIYFVFAFNNNALGQDMTVNGVPCSDITREPRPKNWEKEKNWILCNYSQQLVSAKNHVAFRQYQVMIPLTGRLHYDPPETSVSCAMVLRSQIGDRFRFTSFRPGKPASTTPLTQAHFAYCNNALVKAVTAKESDMIEARQQQMADEQWWDSLRKKAQNYFLLGGVLLAPILLYRSRQTLYAMFVRHPAQKVVDHALSSDSRVATSELQTVLERTPELAKRPPAPWKTKIMTEKAEELTKRLDEESRLAEAAIERDRRRQRRKLESR